MGVFDFLHFGHLRHFKAAKQRGDVLVVTVTPDQFVSKGLGRPVFPQEYRVEFVAALAPVDYVALNRWPSAVETIRLLRPAVFVKGSDYKIRDDNVNPNIFSEERAIQEVGGKLVYTDEIMYSSTELLQQYCRQLEVSQHDELLCQEYTHSAMRRNFAKEASAMKPKPPPCDDIEDLITLLEERIQDVAEHIRTADNNDRAPDPVLFESLMSFLQSRIQESIAIICNCLDKYEAGELDQETLLSMALWS